jgi:hypothetical protein
MEMRLMLLIMMLKKRTRSRQGLCYYTRRGNLLLKVYFKNHYMKYLLIILFLSCDPGPRYVPVPDYFDSSEVPKQRVDTVKVDSVINHE